MALSLVALPSGFVAPVAPAARMAAQMVDLGDMAKAQNPVVGFWDPLNLAEANFWEQGNEATVGWLRHAEMKHGRVAMAAFVGYCVHENGIQLPIHVPGDYTTSSPAELWDQIPEA